MLLEEVKQGRKAIIPTVTLRDLQPGQKGRVVKIKARGERNKRIVEMGITRGVIIEVERVAPLGDPIGIKVKGYHLSLRKEEAEGIEMEALSVSVTSD
jgi:DtxR family Mn-dependent transcriptional regulator